MKPKNFYFLLFTFIFCLSLCPAPHVLSQIPQGFNYQAIARDGSGNPITDPFDVKIAVLSDDDPETVLWEEIHTGVDPDDQGLFSIVVGQGVYDSGPVTTFSDIDWTALPKYIRTQIYYGGEWKNMGSTQLWSVPYAMVADSLGGPLKKLSVAGETIDLEEALFEVKNNTGQTVFAVYNEGVRIYVDDGAKGPKGGFAIGGFGTEKGTSIPLLVVDPDSIRMYIDQSSKTTKGGFAIGGYGADKADAQKFLFVSDDSVRVYIDNADTDIPKGVKGGFAIGGYGAAKSKPQDLLTVSNDSVRIYIDREGEDKGPKGGFAIGGFGATKNGDSDYFNVSTDTNKIIDPSQNRILWYPQKNAFLTGRILIEDPDSVGENSFASGYESKAIGKYSQALGYQAIARNNYSTAIGYQAIANEINSFALGQWATAKNEESYAFGRGAVAEGFRSFAFGSAGIDSLGALTRATYAQGNYSFAIGQGSVAEGFGSIALGLADTARGDYSVGMGYITTAGGYGSTAMGRNTIASGKYSTALGHETVASGDYSIAMGKETIAGGGLSTAMGLWSEAIGSGSTAMGRGNVASGAQSTAMGWETLADGESSTSMGKWTKAYGTSSTAMGDHSQASGESSTALGSNTKASGDFSIAMGSGTISSGWRSFAGGYYSQAKASRSIAMGYRSRAEGVNATAIGISTISRSLCSFAIGSYNDTLTSSSQYLWQEEDPLFVIGNGTENDNRHNALTLLKNGNLGIGTISPDYLLDVNGSATIRGNLYTGTCIEINSLNSGNRFAYIDFHGDDNYTDYGLRLIRYNEGENSASRIHHRGTGTLQIYAQDAAPIIFYTSAAARMTIASNGYVGIGTSSPDNKFVVNNGSTIGRYTTSGWTHTSDIRLKSDITSFSGILQEVLKLKGVRFRFTKDVNGDSQIGFIAQDVEKIFPEFVVTDRDGYKSVAYGQISAVIVEAIKEQQEEIDELKQIILEMQDAIASLHSE